ncbi:MAG: hypothetical protein LBQ73_11120 [Tannerellaceae bacterium]|nr:hypothetical protein [Tannerellaceae bacterium]
MQSVDSLIRFNVHCVLNQVETKAAIEGLKTLEYVFVNTQSGESTHIRQESTEQSFGSLSVELRPGAYDCIIVAHSSDDAAIENNTITFDKGSETFRGVESFELVPGDAPAIQVTLDRANTKLEVISADKLPQTAQTIELRVTNLSNALDLLTGKGGSTETIERRFTLRASDVGKANLKFTISAFTDDEQESVLTIRTYDKNNTLMKETISAPFITRHNTISRFTGYLFHTTSTPGLEITINQDWNGEYEYELPD